MVARTGMLTALTDRNGNTITDLYNSANQLASITDTQGRVTTTGAYGTNGFITSLHDPAGRPSQYAYTGNYLTGYLDPATQQTTYTFVLASRREPGENRGGPGFSPPFCVCPGQ